MRFLARLDAISTGGEQFHKPRHGSCELCARPAIEHPCWAHRRAALRALITVKIVRFFEHLYWQM